MGFYIVLCLCHSSLASVPRLSVCFKTFIIDGFRISMQKDASTEIWFEEGLMLLLSTFHRVEEISVPQTRNQKEN